MSAHIAPVRAASNRRRAQLAVAAVGAIPAAVIFVIDAALGRPYLGLAMALAIGLVVSLWAWRSATLRALAGLRATTADQDAHPRLHNLVDGLCAAAGVVKPELYVRSDDRLDACTLGVDPSSTHLVVTTGLLEQLTRVELEAVVAHELAHIKQLDIAPATLVAGLSATPAGGLIRAIASRKHDDGEFGSEPNADLDGVRLTRYPPGLISALEKVASSSSSAGADPNYPWLSAEERPDELRFRIDVLREL